MDAVKYITHTAIDKQKWDNAINKADNGFIYSRSFFLDALCSWDALVMGDYEYVMPLPYKTKMGFCYLYTPYFIGQLGITGNAITVAVCEAFINAIPPKFSYIDILLNESNLLSKKSNRQIIDRTNFVLALDKDYESLASSFNKDAKKNLRQAAQYRLEVDNNVTLQKVVDLYKSMYGNVTQKIEAEHYQKFQDAAQQAIEQKMGFVIGIKNSDAELLAAGFFAIDNKRIYYLLGAPSAEGKKANATHVLIDEVIKKYAGSGLALDFEGSDIPSVATFYSKFNPQKNSYAHLTINRLPFWIKWWKNRK